MHIHHLKIGARLSLAFSAVMILTEVFALQDAGQADHRQVQRLADQKTTPVLKAYNDAGSYLKAITASGCLLLASFGVLAVLLGAALVWWLTCSIAVPLRRAAGPGIF